MSLPHTFENPCPIIGPLVLIVVADQIAHSVPVSMVDGMKEIFGVQPDLMLGSPQPDEIQPNANRQHQPAIEPSTKRNRHRQEFFFCEDSGDLAGRISYVKDGSTGSFTSTSRSQPSFCNVMCSIAIVFALASRSGRI